MEETDDERGSGRPDAFKNSQDIEEVKPEFLEKSNDVSKLSKTKIDQKSSSKGSLTD